MLLAGWSVLSHSRLVPDAHLRLALSHPFEEWITESQLELESLSPSLFGQSATGDFEGNPKDLRTCRAVVEGELMLPADIKFGSNDASGEPCVARSLHQADRASP